jgi:hypothetical protein
MAEIVTIQLVVDSNDHIEGGDGLNAVLRKLTRPLGSGSASFLLDYRMTGSSF